jgi:hypothetical protein
MELYMSLSQWMLTLEAWRVTVELCGAMEAQSRAMEVHP